MGTNLIAMKSLCKIIMLSTQEIIILEVLHQSSEKWGVGHVKEGVPFIYFSRGGVDDVGGWV